MSNEELIPPYVLEHPFTARVNGVDTQVEQLAVPEIVTVGMMRKIAAGTTMLFAHELTEALAGLGPFEAAKLQTPDAIAYTKLVNPLLDAKAEPGFAIPEIKVFKALLKKITVDTDRKVEFVAQVLQHSGMKRADIDAMDFRDFAPAMPLVLELFPGPNS
ncbi:MAG: hypothetical protein V4706_02900 [Pseudomonadota bacterium]